MENTEALSKVLGETIYFQGLPQEILTSIAQIAHIKKYSKNETIFFEGERAFGFFMVLDGYVKIYKLSSKGKEQIIHIFGRGEIFAEIVLSGHQVFPAHAQALTATTLAYFDKGRFLQLIKSDPQLALYIIGLFAHRLRNLVQTIENLSLREARERLLAYLWDLSSQGKRESVNIGISKAQLALLLGITPETLSRLLQKFREEGLLEIKTKEWRILNPENWRKILGES